eukprot:CAMPEP_0172655722 /NCGR_PEP_ID=MMETSP1074-20121228/882_1 /TAXON_ID=2916 /ORGANISM="Ceratium fusus, Strain PA161109" /LENGTH=60 /DNA_ID=CAMNT_0013470433 /DNA_START=35 /DNA_END=214 /DNA_ORIENTATION=+
MVAITVKNIPPMQHTVVVQEHDVPLFHHHPGNIPLTDLVDVPHIFGADALKVATVDIRHA